MRPTEKDCWEIVEDKTIRFFLRLKKYRTNHWVMSQPVAGLNEFKKEFKSYQDLMVLCNLVRCLQDYKYDIGDFRISDVALKMYGAWKKHLKPIFYKNNNPTDIEMVAKEFKARGFIPMDHIAFDLIKDSYIETIGLKTTLIYPKRCYHMFEDKKLYKEYIYDFHVRMGIPGYTRANIPNYQKM